MVKELITQIIKALVNTPEDVIVDKVIDERGVLYTVKVRDKEGGAVIGRQGSTIRAIRALMHVVGVKNNERINIKLDF